MYKNCPKTLLLENIDTSINTAHFFDENLGNCKLEFTELESGALHPYMIVTSKNEYIEYYETDIVFNNLFDVLSIFTLSKKAKEKSL